MEEDVRNLTTEVLLAGFGGALAVFILGAFREWWREERESEGLLRLLLDEIDHNDEVTRTIGEMTDDLLGSDDFPSLSTESRHDAQGRAAALLPDELSVTLNRYYSLLQTTLTLREFKNRGNERMNRGMTEMYSELFGREFARSRNPWNDYLKATQDAQERARERIHAYLARPWDERLLVRLSRWLERLVERTRRGRKEPDGS